MLLLFVRTMNLIDLWMQDTLHNALSRGIEGVTLKVHYRTEHREPDVEEQMYKRSVVRLQNDNTQTGSMVKERPRREGQP